MGQKSIIDKVNELVNSWELDPIEERDIVYLFVEIGKFLEQGVPKDQYQYLRFFRNWTAHYKINDIRVIKEFIPAIQFDQPAGLDENKEFKHIFKNLILELSNFLQTKDIDPSTLHTKREEFISGLIAILAEQPLVLEKVQGYIVIEPNSRTFILTETVALE